MNEKYIIKDGVLTFQEQVTEITPELVKDIDEKEVEVIIIPPTVEDIKGGVLNKFIQVNRIIMPNHFKKFL